MPTPCCHTFLAFILKFLNFLRAFLGVAMIVYSAYMLNQWQHHHNQFPPLGAINSPLVLASGVLSSDDDELFFNFHSLPCPCYGIGILVCCITCIGFIGAEAINGCFLCFYAVMMTMFILSEVGLATFIALDRHWEKDMPFDPTGQLYALWTFIEDNFDVFEWVGIAIIVIQVLSLLFAIILRSLVSHPRVDNEIEGDSVFRTGTREPLLSPYTNQASGSTRGDSDIWSLRMREKVDI